MSLINKIFLTATISTLGFSNAIACPVTIEFGSGLGDGVIHYSGIGVDAYYIVIGNTTATLTVKKPGGGQWSLNCDENQADCYAALDDIFDGHTPDQPPSAEEPPSDDKPSEDKPDGGIPPFSSEIPGMPKGPFDRSQTTANSDCDYFKNSINKIRLDLMKREINSNQKTDK